ncbi:MAG: hypothetical protein A2166_05465 [Omnitrophica WOR_2 bacterium RBG_13_41_10]|nr:MAG: hypothetical protein A2166_05465 [Omnitrophica WOR_2 bacterium RBG_13_41_10]
MKKYTVTLFVLLMLLAGCSRSGREEKPLLAKIRNYEITLDEFENDFKDSSYGRDNSLEARMEFLNSLVDRKLIMQDVQEQGLDKNKNFLKMIERFWEQSLLKLTLDKKTKEIAGSLSVSEKEIEEAYEKMPPEAKTDKALGQMHDEIKWGIAKRKEAEALNNWILGLRKKSEVKINYNLLK